MNNNILVSACLLGAECRYDATGVLCKRLAELKSSCNLIPFCPEIYGGLPTPREPAEIVGDKVITRSGNDVTGCYKRGAEQALKIARLFGCKTAILKQRSPSCGNTQVYDGSFSGKIIDGEGITAALLKQNGITVFNENEISDFLNIMLDKQ